MSDIMRRVLFSKPAKPVISVVVVIVGLLADVVIRVVLPICMVVVQCFTVTLAWNMMSMRYNALPHLGITGGITLYGFIAVAGNIMSGRTARAFSKMIADLKALKASPDTEATSTGDASEAVEPLRPYFMAIAERYYTGLVYCAVVLILAEIIYLI
jgi:hypothetical protein